MGKHGTGNVREHPNGFRVRLSVNGVKVDKVINVDTEDEAREWAEAEADRLKEREVKGLAKAIPFSELLKDYEADAFVDLAPNTRKTYQISMDAFETFFVRKMRDPMVDTIRKRDINAFLRWRRKHAPNGDARSTPLKARSVNKDRACLRTIFTFAQDEEYIEANPVARTKKRKGDKREPIILTDDEYEDLLAACKDRPMLWTFVLLLGETGVRCESEALWIRWQDINFEKNRIKVDTVQEGHRTKSGKSRWVPMTRRLREALQFHAARFQGTVYHGKTSPWVFHHETDRRRATAGHRVGSLRRAFDAAVVRTDLPEGQKELNQHDLRHRRCTTWLAAGKPPQKVQKALGWSSMKIMMDTYAHLLPDDIMDLVEEPEDDFMELVG